MTSSRQDPGKPLDDDVSAATRGGAETELYTLGHVRLIEQGSEKTSKLGPKHLALLVYLSHERRPMHPTEVTDLLGRGQEEEKEIAALRRAVSWLSENVPGAVFRVSADTIDPIDGVWVDSAEVDAAIDRGDPSTVAQLYIGEFLDGFVSGAPAFDEWASKERGRLKRAWSHAMLSAARRAEHENDWETAAQWWQLLVARAPMRPEAVAGLLRALVRGEQEDRATTAYFSYAALLAENGISQPADLVKEVLAEYPALQESTGVRVEIPEPPEVEEPEAAVEEPIESAAARDEAAAETAGVNGAPDPDHTFESLSSALDAEFEAELQVGSTGPDVEAVEGEAGAAEELDLDLESEADLERELAAPEPGWLAEGFVDQDGEIQELEWQDVVDLASSDETDFEVSGELPSEALEYELQALGEPVDAFEAEDEGEELFEADLGILEEAELAELTDSKLAADADLRETPYDQGAAYLDAQPETAGEEETVEADTSGSVTAGANAAGDATRAVFGAHKAVGRKLGSLAGPARVGSRLTRLRHYWYVPVALGVAALTFALGPKLLDTVGDLPEVDAPALPRVNLPKVTVKTPGFVETSVSRIGELLSGPILEESGQWVLVADFQLEAPAAESSAADDSGVREAVPDEGTSDASPEEVDAEAAFDASVVPDPSDSVSNLREDTIGQRPSRSATSTRFERAAPGSSDSGMPGFDHGASGQPLPVDGPRPNRLPPAALQDTTAPAPQDTMRQQRQDSTPLVQPDSTQVPPAPADSAQVADTAQSIRADSAEVQSADSILSAPAAVAAAEDSLGQPAAEPQERLSLAALARVAEADLDQADFFQVVPHERALVALERLDGQSVEALPVAAALRLAESEGWSVVVSGRVKHGEQADSLKLLVLNAAGDTLYGVAAEVSSKAAALETLAELTHAIRRRLGEPEEEVKATPTLAQLLSPTNAALNAYAEARAHLYTGRIPQAANSASEAVQRDTTFVLAYVLLADAYAQGGERASGRAALEKAWTLSGEATERDSLRIAADRLAWDGRLSEAVVTYDELFQRYRDDVVALKSQALLQRMIGARGGGEGNLRVAYTLDPYDWPRLSRIAQYLGYSGSLPDVDSLIASLEEPPAEESPSEEPPSEP